MARPCAFPKAARLRRRREFLNVQARGQRRHGRHFVVIRAPGPSPLARLGVTVSSRVGNAVVRNRLKRLVREAFRLNRHGYEGGMDFVVIAKPGAERVPFREVTDEVTRALGLTPRG